jgi:hypothetical protein
MNAIIMLPATNWSRTKTVANHDAWSVAVALETPAKASTTTPLKLIVTWADRHAVTIQLIL